MNIYIIPVVVVLGVITLFFFPEPETHFLAYAGTALAFITITVCLIIGYVKTRK